MKKWTHNERLIEIIAALFILLFLYTGISKIREHTSFRIALSQSPLLGSTAGLLSWLLPITEIITASLLLFPITRKHGLMISLGLMSLFTIYIAFMVFFIPSLPCSCGGVLKELNWNQHLSFNIFFTALSIIALWLTKRNKLFIAINRKSRTPV